MNEKIMQFITIEKNEHAKQTREEDTQAQDLLILFYLSNYNILKSRNRLDK